MGESGKSPEEAALDGEGHDILCREYGTATAVHDTASGCNCGSLFLVRHNELLRTIEFLTWKAGRYERVMYRPPSRRRKDPA
jgi:hypothetical protein